jgi:hypothetical protein
MFIVRDEVPDAIGTDFMRPDGILFARQKSISCPIAEQPFFNPSCARPTQLLQGNPEDIAG